MLAMADFQPGGEAPLSSSPIPVDSGGKVLTPSMEAKDYPVPRALETDEVPRMAEEYAEAARYAIEAGMCTQGVHSHAKSDHRLSTIELCPSMI